MALSTWQHQVPSRWSHGASLEQLQLEIGIGSAVIEFSYEVYGQLATYGWWQNLWEFVSAENIILKWEEAAIPPLQREGDAYIMECFIQCCQWPQADICKFNLCRIKMQAFTLADIIHGDRIHLNKQIKAISLYSLPESKYDWAQEEPASSDWNIWQKGLKLLTSKNELLPHFKKLGHWLT